MVKMKFETWLKDQLYIVGTCFFVFFVIAKFFFSWTILKILERIVDYGVSFTGVALICLIVGLITHHKINVLNNRK